MTRNTKTTGEKEEEDSETGEEEERGEVSVGVWNSGRRERRDRKKGGREKGGGRRTANPNSCSNS